MRLAGMIALLAVLTLTTPAPARVVINEIFYNAPDDLDDIQWIEFYSTADQPVDLSQWTLDKGNGYVFPKGTTIEAQGYLVVALKPDEFRKIYGVPAIGPLKRPLKRGGERLELLDARGQRVDAVRYGDRDPWPVSADGESASLERISPSVAGDLPENWAASPLPTVPKPAGTPGERNASFSAALPPVITDVTGLPDNVLPDERLHVEAEVRDRGALREVSLLYRTVVGGVEGKESAVPMTQDAATGRFRATIPGQPTNTLVRYRIKAVNEAGAQRLYPGENDLRPTFSAYVHDKWEASPIALGLLLLGGPDKTSTSSTQSRPPTSGGPPGGRPGTGGRGPAMSSYALGPRQEQPPRPPRGASTFIFVDHRTGKTMVFDHISTVPRINDRGFRVFFHKDHTLNNMSAVNLVFEGSEWSLIAEALSYDVYHRAGSPAPLSEFVRVWVDGRLVGPHLMVERPNRSFLRRNEIDDNGNLYKTLWTGRDPVSRHQKKTNEQAGHEDLLALLDQLDKAEGNPDDLWKVIQENFDVEQVATYFAVNMIISHWDGFFNNYFAYHDVERNKWQMYPWDQDKTWGYYDGLPDDQVFFDMPLTYGMEGDQPPGRSGDSPAGRGSGRGFGGRAMWWRRGGEFSRPLLANPQFRAVFLSRTKEILETIYTQDVYFPLIDEMADRLIDDLRLAAKSHGEDPENSVRVLEKNVPSLRTHLLKRRGFLLEQEELRSLGEQGRSQPVAPDQAVRTPSTSALVINELMAANQTTIRDPQGDNDDWIELLNVGEQELDLSGMYLTDKKDNPRKWAFPKGTTLGPGAYIIVWADEEGHANPGLHANFKLGKDGETVMLIDADARGNAMLDSVTFGKQRDDVAFGRLPDGKGAFRTLLATPGGENKQE
ncbi:MAG: CotH kinase family protein [bacterium]|nr:CotH kinase family protein [bacterium]